MLLFAFAFGLFTVIVFCSIYNLYEYADYEKAFNQLSDNPTDEEVDNVIDFLKTRSFDFVLVVKYRMRAMFHLVSLSTNASEEKKLELHRLILQKGMNI